MRRRIALFVSVTTRAHKVARAINTRKSFLNQKRTAYTSIIWSNLYVYACGSTDADAHQAVELLQKEKLKTNKTKTWNSCSKKWKAFDEDEDKKRFKKKKKKKKRKKNMEKKKKKRPPSVYYAVPGEDAPYVASYACFASTPSEINLPTQKPRARAPEAADVYTLVE